VENSGYVWGNVRNLHILAVHFNLNHTCKEIYLKKKETAWHNDGNKNSLTTYALISVALLFSR
jgi:hypothetical protein